MSKENIPTPQIYAGIIGAIVENKTLDDSLKEVGLSEEILLNQLVAPQSSDIAKDYIKEELLKEFGLISRDKNSDLYLIKKALCNPEDYKSMAEAVSKNDTDKFKVLRLISCDYDFLRCKQNNYSLNIYGFEIYLVSGKNQLEAVRKTTKNNSIFKYYKTSFNEESIRKCDQLFTDAIYYHTKKTMEKVFRKIRN